MARRRRAAVDIGIDGGEDIQPYGSSDGGGELGTSRGTLAKEVQPGASSMKVANHVAYLKDDISSGFYPVISKSKCSWHQIL